MRLAVILVHYHTPDLAAAAVEALQADVSGIETEWLLVDNGSDEAGRARLASLPVERIDPGENLGYAGAVNLGIRRSRADVFLILNPDVLVLPGCVPALLDALRGGAAVAAPQSYWDRGRRMLLPPTERRTRRDESLAFLAGQGERWAEIARARWRRHARLHWEAREPLASHSLSGSLLALQRAAWERVGPFDEGFRLYFEETDWLLRAAALGLPGRYVPQAEAVHLHSQSAAAEPRAQTWFEQSAHRFRRKHYGAAFTAALEGAARRLPGPGAVRGPAPPASPVETAIRELDLAAPAFANARYPLWMEVSPNPGGFPAAAERLESRPDRPWRLPAEVDERLPPGRWRLQVSDAGGSEVARRILAVGKGD
jgi:N-acetylglucosaminyl-diphospho-decaprenol L-rhamnosyltransferase